MFIKLSSLICLSTLISFNLYSMDDWRTKMKANAEFEFKRTCQTLPPIVDIALPHNMFTRILDGAPDIATAQLIKEATEKPQTKSSSTQTNLVYQPLRTPQAIAYAYFLARLMNNQTPNYNNLTGLPLIPTATTAKGSGASNK